MDIATIISALAGAAGGALSTFVALRTQRLNEIEAIKQAYLNHHQLALDELRKLIDLQRDEINRLRTRIDELEQADALKSEMIEDLARLLEREQAERAAEHTAWEQERQLLRREIASLHDALEDWRRWDPWEASRGLKR